LKLKFVAFANFAVQYFFEMDIKEAVFVVSNSDFNKIPQDKIEYAFIGRSNVGKSSLINMITGNKKLAKTSGRPGKTQLINHFLINNKWYLVDLPGYGYARASKTARGSWEKFIVDYLTKSKQLINVFVLIDSRLEPQTIDLEFINWCGSKEIPFTIVFTKIDKISNTVLQKNVAKYKKEMLLSWEVMPPYFMSSSTSGVGKEQILNFIGEINADMEANPE
jgi:GTP-binding protein